MAIFERHVFVCINERAPGHPRGCCSDKDSVSIREALKARCKLEGLATRVRINKSACLDQCEHGPTIVVYPEAIWYGFVKTEDIEEIVQTHLIGGAPVERLVLPKGCINTPHCPHRGGSVQLGGYESVFHAARPRHGANPSSSIDQGTPKRQWML